MQRCVIVKTPLCTKVNLESILPSLSIQIRYMSSKQGPLGPIGVLAPSKSNFEVDSTSHYKESTKLQYPMYNNETLRVRVRDLLSVVLSLPMN